MLRVDAIIVGTVTTVIIFLINQLFFVLIAAYSGLAGVEHEFWAQYKDVIWQGMGMATLCCSMLLGGGVVRWLVNHRQWQHGLVVGALTSGMFIWSSGDRGELNLMSLAAFITGAACCALGAHYSPWPKPLAQA